MASFNAEYDLFNTPKRATERSHIVNDSFSLDPFGEETKYECEFEDSPTSLKSPPKRIKKQREISVTDVMPYLSETALQRGIVP